MSSPFHFTEREGKGFTFSRHLGSGRTRTKIHICCHTESRVYTPTCHTAPVNAPVDRHSHLAHILTWFVCLHTRHCTHLLITHRLTCSSVVAHSALHVHSLTRNPHTHISIQTHTHTCAHTPFRGCQHFKLLATCTSGATLVDIY